MSKRDTKSDTKHRSDVGTRASEQINAIHQILNEEPNGAEGDKRAVRRIREVLYGKLSEQSEYTLIQEPPKEPEVDADG